MHTDIQGYHSLDRKKSKKSERPLLLTVCMDAFMSFSLTHSYLVLTEILVSSVLIVAQKYTKYFLKTKQGKKSTRNWEHLHLEKHQ